MRKEQAFSVRGDTELMTRAGHLFESARSEFLCGARDLRTWSQPRARAAIRNRMRVAYSSGFTSRKLLSPVALADEEARTHLRMVQSNGAAVRISSSPMPHETILIDRRVMIIAGQPTPPAASTPSRRRRPWSRGSIHCSRRSGAPPPISTPTCTATPRASTQTAA